MQYNITTSLIVSLSENGFGLDELIYRMEKLAKAVNYLERAKHAIFGYVRRWLALGLVCPRASSFIERTMRAIGRASRSLATTGRTKAWARSPALS